MPLTIKLGDVAKPPQATIELQIRKTLDGSLIISDHHKMDIVVQPSDSKIFALPKPYAGDKVYEYQKDLMEALFRSGVIAYNSIKNAASFGVLESTYIAETTQKGVDPIEAVLYSIDKFLKETAAQDTRADAYDQHIEDRFTDPTDEDSTRLGSVKPVEDDPYAQQDYPGYTYSGYGYLY